MYPIKLAPVFKSAIWGGLRLETEYGFERGSLKNMAEGWMLTARDNGDNTVIGGEFDGMSFKQFVKEHPEVLGTKGSGYSDFPLLIKIIDAADDLSIQVHPDDEYARIHENSFGKTEAWYIIDCVEGAELVYGFTDKIDREVLRKAIADNNFDKFINKVKVKKGEIYYIPSGTLHAICGGILIAEVQQNCDTTYRVYDYHRLVDGEYRDLDVDKALDVVIPEPPADIRKASAPVTDGDAVLTELCKCEYFKMTAFEVNGEYSLTVGSESFMNILVFEGEGQIVCGDCSIPVKKGDSVFVPADCGTLAVTGTFKALLSTL